MRGARPPIGGALVAQHACMHACMQARELMSCQQGSPPPWLVWELGAPEALPYSVACPGPRVILAAMEAR